MYFPIFCSTIWQIYSYITLDDFFRPHLISTGTDKKTDRKSRQKDCSLPLLLIFIDDNLQALADYTTRSTNGIFSLFSLLSIC